MNKYYESPELEVRKYNFSDVAYTTSQPESSSDGGEIDLNDGDDYDPFA